MLQRNPFLQMKQFLLWRKLPISKTIESSKEAHKLMPRIKWGHYPAWWGVSHDGITSSHFCEKSIKTALRNYQRDILTNVVEPLNQTMFQNRKWIFQQDSARKAKLGYSGLKIMYPNLLVVTIGRQPAQTLIHSTTTSGQFWKA